MPKYTNANTHWIKTLAQGKKFVDVGCMWAVTGDYCFLAEKSGASQVVGIDIYPPQKEFIEKIQLYKSNVKFVKGDINSEETVKSTLNELSGTAELVFCSGVLYHVPDPVFTLRKLGSLLSDGGQLILNTMTIPEQGTPCTSILLSGLDTDEITPYILGRQGVGLTEKFDVTQGYANWVWGMTPSCVREMVKIAGFEIIDEDMGVNQEIYACLANKIEKREFHDTSGDWSKYQNNNVWV
jgi:SAM-dependent methyltransferase